MIICVRGARCRVMPVLLTALAGCLFLGGCATRSAMVGHAVDCNQAVEREQNRILLLNILRAKDQRPMYFTAISQLRGS